MEHVDEGKLAKMGGYQEGDNSDEDFEMKDEDVKWLGKGQRKKDQVFYSGVTLKSSIELKQGDSVLLNPTNPQAKCKVATIKLLYESPLGASAHLQYFCRATDALLGDKADPRELYFTDECKNVPLNQIRTKCTVERRLDSTSSVPETVKSEGFWASHWHDGGKRFEKIQTPIMDLKDQDNVLTFCEVCLRRTAKEGEEKPELIRKTKKSNIQGIKWKKTDLKRDDGVMIPSNSVELPGKVKPDRLCEMEEQKVDNDLYTEHYRKKKGQIKPQCNPLQIGQILEIKEENTKSISLKIRLFYRPGDSSCFIWKNANYKIFFPEDADLGVDRVQQSHYSLLFGSSVEVDIDFNEVQDVCFLKFFPIGEDDEVIEVWCEEGPNRFYFQQVSPSIQCQHKSL